MKRHALVFALAAALGALPLLAVEKSAAKTKIVFEDPAGDITPDEGDAHPVDVVKVELSSDGKFIVVDLTLAEVSQPKSIFQALLLGVAFDIDNSVKTGGQGFAGGYGDVPGIDFESELLASVEDGGPSKSASASVIRVDAKGNQSSVLYSSDAPITLAKGKVYTGRIAYESLGVKPGQTIRVIARELTDRGEKSGMFPDALLTLQ
jgi:hypothetical protein